MTTVGFTGTRHGMTQAQQTALRLALTNAHHLRHGDCVGADEQADRIAADLGIMRTAHPPIDPRLRAWCKAEQVLTERPYLARNRRIVDDSVLLIAAPMSRLTERRTGGTWYTIRYAREQGKPGLIVWPDGTTSPLEVQR